MTRRQTLADRRSMELDVVWAALDRVAPMDTPLWVRSKGVTLALLDGRGRCGIAFTEVGSIVHAQRVTYLLNRLVAQNRARIDRAPGRHPLYQANNADDYHRRHDPRWPWGDDYS